MNKLEFNQSKGSLDYFFQNHTSWLSELSINDYPVVMIFWNLFLIIIPWLLCGGLQQYWRQTKFKTWYHKLGALSLAGLWLLFIPNTAYIITDVRHVVSACSVISDHHVCLQDAWTIAIFFTYAIIGWLAFVWLIKQMRQLIKKIWKEQGAQIYVGIIIPLVALGVLLGLLNRWNSWEIFGHPLALIQTMALYFTNFAYFGNWLIFSLFLYILYGLGSLVLKELSKIKLK
ncbi:MAG: DUF1361 domain-containing protein [bacterium]